MILPPKRLWRSPAHILLRASRFYGNLDDASDPWFRSVLLSAIALSRLEEAVEFLLALVRTESLQAEAAIEALVRAMPSAEVIQRLEEVVAGNPRLARIFATHRHGAPSKAR